jgi:hypothetical protein
MCARQTRRPNDSFRLCELAEKYPVFQIGTPSAVTGIVHVAPLDVESPAIERHGLVLDLLAAIGAKTAVLSYALSTVTAKHTKLLERNVGREPRALLCSCQQAEFFTRP